MCRPSFYPNDIDIFVNHRNRAKLREGLLNLGLGVGDAPSNDEYNNLIENLTASSNIEHLLTLESYIFYGSDRNVSFYDDVMKCLHIFPSRLDYTTQHSQRNAIILPFTRLKKIRTTSDGRCKSWDSRTTGVYFNTFRISIWAFVRSHTIAFYSHTDHIILIALIKTTIYETIHLHDVAYSTTRYNCNVRYSTMEPKWITSTSKTVWRASDISPSP